MSDDVDFDMETVEEDELDELGAGGASNSEERTRSWSKESKEAGTEGSDKRSEGVRKGRLSDLQGASVSPSKSEKRTELINGVLWSKVGSIPDGWEFVNLGPEVSIQTGYNAPSKNFIEEGGIPLIRNRDLGSKETEIQYDGDYGEEYLIEDGDLLVSMDGEFEPHLWTGGKALLNQRVCKIESSDRYSHIFLAYAIEKPLYLLQKSIAGTTVKHLSKSNIRSVNLPTPPLPEQRKVASVLYTVDQAIQKTEAIIEQAKRVKRGLMQLVLTRGVSEQGDIRDIEKNNFKESSLGQVPREWGVHNLGKDFDIEYGSEKKEKELITEGYPVYGANGVIGRSEEYLYEEPVVTVTCRGATCGTVHLTEPRSWVTNNSLVLLGGSTFNKRFLAEALRYHSVERAISGSAQPQITSGMLAKMDYPVPSIEEQNRIAEFLTTWEDNIRHEKKCMNQLKGLKKGLMQDLLTGEVRTMDKTIEVLGEVKAHG